MNEIKKCLVLIIFLFIFSFLDVATTAYMFCFCEKYGLVAMELNPVGFNVFTVSFSFVAGFVALFLLIRAPRDCLTDTEITYFRRLKYVLLGGVCLKVFVLGWNSAIIFMMIC